MAEVESLERALLVEKHLISPNHTRNPHFKGLLLKKEQDVSIMINEEDHIRIQVLFPGLQLEKASTLAETFDDAFEARIPYAYDQEYGYLTACPTNVGTGMRASVMVHLPALVRVNRVKQVLGPISKFGLVVRGLYGEGSEAHGNIYQISNQISLGHKEEEIMAHLLSITSKVINGERQAREYLMQPERRLNVEDHVYRAYGLLAHARTIGTEEALGLLSQLRLGIDLGLVKSFDKNILKQLMVLIRAAHLQKVMGQNLPEEERDRLRASLIREKMKS